MLPSSLAKRQRINGEFEVSPSKPTHWRHNNHPKDIFTKVVTEEAVSEMTILSRSRHNQNLFAIVAERPGLRLKTKMGSSALMQNPVE